MKVLLQLWKTYENLKEKVQVGLIILSFIIVLVFQSIIL